jgi:hypothetical protein
MPVLDAVWLGAFCLAAGNFTFAMWQWLADRRKRALEPAGWFERTQHRHIWIHTTDERTMRGYVKEVSVDGVLLADAEYLPDQGAPMPLGGEAFIPRERVNWVQVPPAPS